MIPDLDKGHFQSFIVQEFIAPLAKIKRTTSLSWFQATEGFINGLKNYKVWQKLRSLVKMTLRLFSCHRGNHSQLCQFTKEISHASTRSKYYNEKFYCKNCLRVVSAMTGKEALFFKLRLWLADSRLPFCVGSRDLLPNLYRLKVRKYLLAVESWKCAMSLLWEQISKIPRMTNSRRVGFS